MSSKFAISAFLGDSSESNRIYRTLWRPSLIAELSQHAHPVHDHGLLGFALSATEYAVHDATPFVSKVKPDQPAVNASANVWGAYRDEASVYNEQQVAIALAVRGILGSLGPTPIELLKDPDTNLIKNDLAKILETLDRSYLLISRQEMALAMASLEEPYNPLRDFKVFKTNHMKVHRDCLIGKQPMSEMSKITYLLACIAGDHSLLACSEQYFSRFPDIGDQTFEGLSDSLAKLLSNRQESLTTASSYACSSYSPLSQKPSSSTTSSSIQQLAESLAIVTQQLAQLRSEKKHTKKESRSQGYCWTHGPGHPGSKCRNPAPGHIDSATIMDKKGGRE